MQYEELVLSNDMLLNLKQISYGHICSISGEMVSIECRGVTIPITKPLRIISTLAKAEAWCLEDGILHREDGPSFSNSLFQLWHILGKRSRSDGPATLWYDGAEIWSQNGLLHCDNGPAMRQSKPRIVEWFAYGDKYDFDGYCEVLKKTPEERLALALTWC